VWKWAPVKSSKVPSVSEVDSVKDAALNLTMMTRTRRVVMAVCLQEVNLLHAGSFVRVVLHTQLAFLVVLLPLRAVHPFFRAVCLQEVNLLHAGSFVRVVLHTQLAFLVVLLPLRTLHALLRRHKMRSNT
jgi:hypothetical protein